MPAHEREPEEKWERGVGEREGAGYVNRRDGDPRGEKLRAEQRGHTRYPGRKSIRLMEQRETRRDAARYTEQGTSSSRLLGGNGVGLISAFFQVVVTALAEFSIKRITSLSRHFSKAGSMKFRISL